MDYRPPPDLKPRHHGDAANTIAWVDILNQWDLVIVDFTETYGIDLDAHRHTPRRWPWARTHILGLLDTDTRLRRALRQD